MFGCSILRKVLIVCQDIHMVRVGGEWGLVDYGSVCYGFLCVV